MTQETIVAAFDTASQAQAAARDLEAAGVPLSDITQHASATMGENMASLGTATADEPAHKEPGFWAKLFGAEDSVHNTYGAYTSDHSVYDRTISGGGTVLSVKLQDAERDGDRIMSIIESHDPIDIEERMSSYGDATSAAAYEAPLPGTVQDNVPAPSPVSKTGDAETIQLAEEELVVGKRLVNRGTTRIRRYVVETPVSADVSLHREDVSIERRPISSSAAVGPDAFTDKTIEVTEMNEEAVVGKTARVVEEVVVRKDVSDRVETIHDTVRREELEVDKVDDTSAKTDI